MISRELKHFHNENRTHVTKKEYAGAEISVGKTPVGKNLLDMDKVVNERQVSSLTSGSQYCAIQLKSNTSYTLTTNCYTDTLASFFLTLPNVVASTVNNGVYSGATYRTATTDETGILWVWTRVIDDGIPILDTSEFDNGTYWAQLEEGNTATGYEPFIRETYPVNAPMDLKIYGASEQTADYVMCEGKSAQTITEQGKNLFDMDKKFDDVIPQLAHAAAYQCDKEKVSETEWRFYNFTKGGNRLAYFVIPFGTKKNTDYVLSLTVNGLGVGGPIGIDTHTTSDTTADRWNLGVKSWKDIITETETDIRISFSFNSGDNELLYFRGYFSQGSATDEGYCLFKEMQLEEGSTLTDYEAFVPDSPSADYPSEITPLIAAGTYKIGTKDARYLIELPDMYEAGGACDKLMFDKISKTARVKRECGDITFNGTENWAYVIKRDGYVRFMTTISTNATGQSNSTANLLCDRFPSASWSGGVENSENVHTYSGDNRIGVTIKAERLSENTANGFKAWLTEHPIRVLYKLKTPAYTELAVTKISGGLSYSRYAEVPWKIYGKNLFSTERVVIYPKLKYTRISNNSFKLSGDTTVSDVNAIDFSLNVSAGTYRLTFRATFRNSKMNFAPNYLFIRKDAFNGTIIISPNMGKDCENKQYSYAFTLEEDCPKLFINFYANVQPTVFTDYLMLIEDIQLEKASTATEFEAYNAVPPESLTPSVDYPHKIYTSREMALKCTGGDTVNSTKIPLMGNAMEVSDIAQSNLVLDGKYYLSDYIEYNSATDKAYRHKVIDDTLFNTTLPIKDQTQAILAEPTSEEITAGYDTYIFKDVQSIQDGFTLTTESYSTDGLPHPKPLNLEASVKAIR